MKNNEQEFSVWPLMIDMLTSILIIFFLINFFDSLLNPQRIEQVIVDMKRAAFVEEFDRTFAAERRNVSRHGEFNYLNITFSDKVLFDEGSRFLKADGRRILALLSTLLKRNNIQSDISRIQVEGHTDKTRIRNRTTYPKDNWELSTARAISVINFMDGYVSSRLFSANGFGPNIPVSTNPDKNRRVEVKIYFKAK